MLRGPIGRPGAGSSHASTVVPQISSFPSLGLSSLICHMEVDLIFFPVFSIIKVLPKVQEEEKRIKGPHVPRAKETHAPELLDRGPKGTLSHGPDL